MTDHVDAEPAPGKEKREDESSVRVAVRIRPQLAREVIDMCQICTSVSPDEKQVFMGKDKAFTFDYVYDTECQQEAVYVSCVQMLVEGCFDGYNATVFAYGQTGSGKTYSMGTGFNVENLEEQIGIIPRAVNHLFNGIAERQRIAKEKCLPAPDFKVNAQFLELYNEEILDLLDNTRDPENRSRKSHIKIHEDAGGGIYVVGLNTRPVHSLQDAIQLLTQGALCRATGSTNMNSQSSRSHAIFTLHIKQQRVVTESSAENNDDEKDVDVTEFETLTAKFHFVDLAGSERLKRTGATGDRAKEGISINCGLLALGNVISALGDKLKRGSHVPYRDSKLTRFLQDSLGGNSRTLMIACVSPSDRDFMETLNTLKYANRARNIKNKVTANQDKTSKQLAALRTEIIILQEELAEYKTGKRTVDSDGVESVNDMFHENTMLQTENNNMRQRIKALNKTIDSLTARNANLLAECDLFKISGGSGVISNEEISKLVEGYVKELEQLRSKLAESESLVDTIRKYSPVVRSPSKMSTSPLSSMPMSYDLPLSPDNNLATLLEDARKDVKRMRRKQRCRQSSHGSDKENVSDNEKESERLVNGDLNENGFEDEDDEETAGGEQLADQNGEEEMEDIDDEGDEDGDDDAEDNSESDEDDDQDSDNIHEDLAELTCEISIKQKLIEELESSQKRLHTMKYQYEDKLVLLQHKITETEAERDTVLANMGQIEASSQGKTKKVRDEYEKKLYSLQSELKKLQAAKKEHAKLVKNQSHYEKQLKTLQHEVSEMKKTKVKLMKQIKEESEKNKQSESRRNKEIAQLRKDQRMKEHTIRTLEVEKKQKELVLRKKQEEVETLRKRQKPAMSVKAAGRVGKYDKPATVPISLVPTMRRRNVGRIFSPRVAKQKWDSIEKNITSVITKRQTISHMEKDMENWLTHREKLTKKMEKYIMKRDQAAAHGLNEAVLKEIDDVVGSLSTQIDYAQENITECQTNIMQMEEAKDEGESVDVSSLLSTATLEEARYLLEHFLQISIAKGLSVSQKETDNRELLAKLHQTELNNTLQQDLLRHMMIDQVDIEVDNLMTNNDEIESVSSSTSSSPVDSMLESQIQGKTVGGIVPNPELNNNKVKARRKTATPQELLYPLLYPDEKKPDVTTATQLESVQELSFEIAEELVIPDPSQLERSVRPDSLMNNELRETGSGDTKSCEIGAQKTVKSDTHSKDGLLNNSLMPPPKPRTRGLSPTLTSTPTSNSTVNNSNIVRPVSNQPLSTRPESTVMNALKRSSSFRRSPEPSPILRRKNSFNQSDRGSRSSSVEAPCSTESSPPNSPVALRKLPTREENVFSRLTSNTQSASPNPNRGSIQATSTGPSTQRSGLSSSTTTSSLLPTGRVCPLVCSHTAEGHTKAVLSVCATDQLLFTSSKDRTAKAWDLQSGKEILSFTGHRNNVQVIKFNVYTGLVYTVSQNYINVWDMRENVTKCIKTLNSSGLTSTGTLSGIPTRQIGMPPGEHQINDISISSDGTTLLCAAANVVRVWDIRRFAAVGKMNGGHSAPVMVLAMEEYRDKSVVVTGSKDHYIKVFDVMSEAAGILTPKFNLEPPHYDGIQALAVQNNILFSGSRDTCIKKWDLTTHKLKQSMNSAHKDWVCGLAFMPGADILLSVCRSGYLKTWQVDNCLPLGEIRAHNCPINAIATNSTSIFTASKSLILRQKIMKRDSTVGIWRPRHASEPSDSSDLSDGKTSS